MVDDPSVVLFGEDVGPLGGVFRVTDGLYAEFGETRVSDSPLAESGIIGTAIGMAIYGLRPVVEMQFDAFSYPAFEQIVSHVAKMRNRTRGKIQLPIVIRIPYAGDIGGVEHHSDSSEAYWAATPGLTVVTPSNPADAYSMLRDAIASDDPVIFMEPKSRYWSKAELALPVRTAPMNTAVVLREGTDVTLIAYGADGQDRPGHRRARDGRGPLDRGHRPAQPLPVRRRHRERLRAEDLPRRRHPRGGRNSAATAPRSPPG